MTSVTDEETGLVQGLVVSECAQPAKPHARDSRLHTRHSIPALSLHLNLCMVGVSHLHVMIKELRLKSCQDQELLNGGQDTSAGWSAVSVLPLVLRAGWAAGVLGFGLCVTLVWDPGNRAR